MADGNNNNRRRPRLMRGVLIVSLALNLAVVGVVVGSALSGRWGKGPRGFDFGIGPMAAALSAGDRDAIRDRLRRGGGDGRLSRAEGRAGVSAVLESLRAQPYDSAVLDGFFDQLQRRTSALQKEAQDALIIQLQAMTPQERAAFADRLEHEISRAPPPRR